MTSFEELGLRDELLQAVRELGFEKPMPVQAEVLPVLLNYTTDLVALAQTGTGKTAAFGLPVIQSINFDDKHTEAVILSPTRELCMQIAKDLTNFSKYLPDLSVVPVYGGASIEVQIKALNKGAKIIVATPGRLLDLIRRKKVDLSYVRYVVLDEADEMLNMGFQEDLNSILSETPNTKNTLLFSATMPKEVAQIAKGYMTNPVELTVGTRNSGSDNVKHYYYLVHAKDRYQALKRIADYYPTIYAIVFCRTKIETQEVANWLMKDGYNADALHGDLSQAQRDYVMNKFRNKNLSILVATDVAARGLDVDNLTHVINYNLPDEIEQYTHRSGRTGRADKSGISIAIINLKEKGKIKQIEKGLGKSFEQANIPTGKEVCEKQLFNMVDKMEHVDINESEIEGFLPDIYNKLEWLSREELIKRFVSVEFNRFLDYYRNAQDLNVVDDKRNKRSADQDDFSQDRNGKKRKGKKGDGNYTRLFINIGEKDNANPPRIIGMINDTLGIRDVKIGTIDIMDSYSFVNVDSDYADLVVDAFKDKVIRKRRIVVDLANPKDSEGKGSNRKSSRGGSRDSRAMGKSARKKRRY